LQFAASLRARLLDVVDEQALDGCIADAEAESADPARWGLTFTRIQTWATIDAQVSEAAWSTSA
jgi:hypothetical protein